MHASTPACNSIVSGSAVALIFCLSARVLYLSPIKNRFLEGKLEFIMKASFLFWYVAFSRILIEA